VVDQSEAACSNYVTNDWGVSGVVTIQNGLALTFTDNRSGTIYGNSGEARATIA